MSPKELQYIEDTLAHAQFMEQKCRHCATQVQDENLKQLIEGIANKHKMMFDNIYQLLCQ